MKRWIRGMRDAFFLALYELANQDRNLVLLTSDTGAICHDEFRKNLKGQYINVGIAEQNMIGVAAGLAMEGKTVYVYAIIPFVTMRCYEQIRVDLCCMNLPVTVVGIGAGLDYSTLGPTHHGTEDISLMRSLPGMDIYSPADSLAASLFARKTYGHPGPAYIRLDREGLPLVYRNEKDIDMSSGFSVLKEGRDLYIISTGRIVVSALEVAKRLSGQSIDSGVIDLFTLRPANEEGLWDRIRKVKYVVTLEEHFVIGGIGSIISEMLIEKDSRPKFKAIGIPHQFCRHYGSRKHLHSLSRINAESVVVNILKWIGGGVKVVK